MHLYTFFLIISWLAVIYNPFLNINQKTDQDEVLRHLSYLASDELKGRGIGTPELDSAANYIADYFQDVGLEPAPGSSSYFQEFELELAEAPSAIELSIGNHEFSMNKNIVMLSGGAIQQNDITVEQFEFGTENEISTQSLEGKLAFTQLGFPENDIMESYFSLIEKKREMIRASGALGLIEIYKSNQVPWERIVGYFGRSGGLKIHDDNENFLHLLINVTTLLDQDIENLKATLTIEINDPKIIPAKNVLGFVNGTDPNLKDEVILLGAHYDHVGIGHPINDASGAPDSIYNGARDNASGTVALMMAAKEIAKNPCKRLVLFVAFTAEESGLIGSKYYASNPVIPLEKTIFNFNNDNGGYSDTTIVTIVGAGRSNTNDAIREGITASGLKMYQSADLDNSFFRGSDNISLSVHGVPSATYSLGFTGMDEEIRKYYHQSADEVESMDLNYITKWIDGYIKAAKNISNMNVRPFWNEDDELEQAGKDLYGIE